MDFAAQNGQLPENSSFDFTASLYEWAEAVVFSLVAVVLVFTFVFRTAGVIGQSMENTLLNGDRVILTSFRYTPKRGDIVVLKVSAPGITDPIIKRVIAVGGQTVNINGRTGKVTVNGKALREPYIKNRTTLPDSSESMAFPLKVPKGYVFVMGDNRGVSYDSRYKAVGLIDVRDIVGHAVLRIFPLNKFGSLK